MIFHTVKPGETVYSISQQYQISSQRLISDNALYGFNGLVVGQCLLIAIPDIIHTVREGETVDYVSSLYGITPLQLFQYNPTLINSTQLYAGESLTISYLNQTDISLDIYGYVYPYTKENLLKVQSTYLTSMAIFSYGFRNDGSLIYLPGDNKVINVLKNYNVNPVFLLSSINEDGKFDNSKATVLFNDISVQNILINNIISVMKEKGYTGVDLDFEYINPSDRDAYIEFVENITPKMNSMGYTVNVDLVPKSMDNQPGLFYEGHDYKRLGDAADTVLLMSYEWGYTYSPPMAVAPVNQVRKVVEYGVSRIDNKKIYMGIPNYGYDWTLPYEKGVTKARVIGNEEAIKIAYNNGSEIKFDTTAQTPYFNYTDNNGLPHEVWFEDARSIKAKYDLIAEYNLKGAGYWNMMRAFIQNWIYVSGTYNINKYNRTP